MLKKTWRSIILLSFDKNVGGCWTVYNSLKSIDKACVSDTKSFLLALLS